MTEEFEKLRKLLASLEKRATALDARLAKLEGKTDQYTPRTMAIMREGIPLEIFSRSALIENEFEVIGQYPYDMHDRERGQVERSIDIHAMKDSVYTVPPNGGARSGESWPERSHILAAA